MYVQPELAAFANQKYIQFKQKYPMFESERLLTIVCDNIQQSMELIREMSRVNDGGHYNQLVQILDNRITDTIDQEELEISRKRVAQIRNQSRGNTSEHDLARLVNNNAMKQAPRSVKSFFGK